jgi:hypothetical protein
MNNHGYNVFWNEPTLDGLPQGKAERRHFVSKQRAEEFVKGIPQEFRPRIYSATPSLVDAADIHKEDERRKVQDRDETDAMNKRRMVELMLQHNITIPAKQFDKWRPTVEKTGRISGVSDGLTCIMTDGLQGYFIREEREPLIGHVEWFEWDEPDVSYIPYIDEHGQKKFFKQVKDKGAPGPYWKRAYRPTTLGDDGASKLRVKKTHAPMTTAAALELIKQLSNGKPQQ